MFNKEEFYRAFGDYAGVPSDVTITDIEEVTESGGYCETCWYEEQAVYVEGVNADGSRYRERVWTSLSDFTRSL